MAVGAMTAQARHNRHMAGTLGGVTDDHGRAPLLAGQAVMPARSKPREK